MLDRIKSKDKGKVQFYLEPSMIRRIRMVAADRGMTQSKYIADLVDRDGAVESLDMEELRATLRGLMFREDEELPVDVANEILEAYIPAILSIFGIDEPSS